MSWNFTACRICSNLYKVCYPIYGEEDESLLSEKIKKCLPIQISKDDLKPKMLCGDCFIKLDDLYNFIELSILTDNKFNSVIQESTNQHVANDLKISVVKNEPEILKCEINQDIVKTEHNFDHLKISPAEEIEIFKSEIKEDILKTEQSDQITHTPNESIAIEEQSQANTKRLFNCTECESTFQSRSTLKKHLATHIPTGPFICSVCNKEFSSLRHLIGHERRHNRLHTCEVCSKSFTCPSNLVTHMRIHTGIKPYICGVEGCSKRFAAKCNLASHQLAHNNLRNFICKICNKLFKTRTSLNVHQRVHSSGNDFECDLCHRKFKWKNNVVAHFKKHHCFGPPVL